MVVWSDAPNTGPFRPAASWPEGQTPGAAIAALCERVLELRMPLTQQVPEPAIAHPIVSGDNIHGVVALGFRSGVPPQAADWLRWGMGWMARRIAGLASAEGDEWRERMFVVLDLLTHVLEQPRAPVTGRSRSRRRACRRATCRSPGRARSRRRSEERRVGKECRL